MAKVAIGSIPEKITYVFSDQREVPVGCRWDISYDSDDSGLKTVKQIVTPAFPVDSTDASMLAKANSWASDGGWNFDTRARIVKVPQTVEVENKGIKNVRVLSLEQRANGSRAYKALIDNFYVDLREEVLMDVLLQVGVKPGGILQGEYVWAKMSSQMKLVRVGSELHRLIVEFDSKKDIKPILKKSLEVGGIYQNRKKQRAVFLGYANTVTYRTTRQYYEKTSDFKFQATPKRKLMMFHQLYDFEPLQAQLSKIMNIKTYYAFHLQTTHNYLEKIDQIDVPDDFISKVRDVAISSVKNKILEFTGHKAPKAGYASVTAGGLDNEIADKSEYLNMSKYGEPTVEPFDVKKLLIFS